ncbi:uncharacterized protein LOC139933446 [Centroberyx gerrardi]|uniref:uncharacterized protein n=1 Tax=Centroberyx gerrardi TaxID=166262 RepID=UPI003AAF385E
MAIRGTLIYLCSLAVLFPSAAQDETTTENCTTSHIQHPLTELKEAAECLLPQWSTDQTAALLYTMRTLGDMLHKHQLTACQGAEPKKCPAAAVHSDGGLVCATVSSKRYCKPMCNDGYDFDFLRRSRLFDECSESTGYTWRSQYIGGTKLAVCSESHVQISGAQTAYFPKDQDCLRTKSSSDLHNSTIHNFITELKDQGIDGNPEYICLVCG